MEPGEASSEEGYRRETLTPAQVKALLPHRRHKITGTDWRLTVTFLGSGGVVNGTVC